MLLKYVYTFFLALLLALFVGVGISVFYPQPQPPKSPERIARPMPEGEDFSERDRAEQEESRVAERKSQARWERFEKRSAIYNRNVSIISLVVSILVLTGTLTIFRNFPVISDGLLLGGVFILGYSIIRGFAANDDKLRFFVITVGLVMTLILGYLKFIKEDGQADEAL